MMLWLTFRNFWFKLNFKCSIKNDINGKMNGFLCRPAESWIYAIMIHIIIEKLDIFKYIIWSDYKNIVQCVLNTLKNIPEIPKIDQDLINNRNM